MTGVQTCALPICFPVTIGYEEAYEKLIEESITKSLAEINFEKYQLLRNGIPVDFIDEKGEQVKNKTLKVFDFDNAENNNFLAVRQLWIQGKSNRERRPDIIGFVNGIPLLFIELKAAHRKLENAYNAILRSFQFSIFLPNPLPTFDSSLRLSVSLKFFSLLLAQSPIGTLTAS